MKETISGRAENGAASAYDLARVEVEVGVLAGHLQAFRADMASESSQLAGLLGLTNGLPNAVGLLQPWEISPRDLFDPASQVALAPSAIAATREAAAAERGINAARKNRWP